MAFVLCVAIALLAGCENDDGGDDNAGDDNGGAAVVADWTLFAGEWHGSGLREVWVSVNAGDGTVTVRDNVNPGSQSLPWSEDHYFAFQGGPTCTLRFNNPDSATVQYTTSVYDMTRVP
ncbi:MAG: hypothetical protein KJ626_09745 [Verrucomicrobia bacterium]|nr:hypothetical protein [Verrucomicrobiota bacterium]